MLSDLDKKVILALQRDLEICPRPFLEVAEFLGMGEEALLAAIQGLMARGYIRRFGATLRHQQSGYEANALVAWAVERARMAKALPSSSMFGQEMLASIAATPGTSSRAAPSAKASPDGADRLTTSGLEKPR